jgi:hypothetical protein
MAIFIPDLFGGYLRGRQAAIADNWTDLNQFNQVLGGQMQNAFNQQVMADRARISNASANISDMNQAVTGATADQQLDLIQQQKLQKLNEAKARLDKAQLDYQTALAEYNQQNLDPKVAGQRAQTINSYINPQPTQAQAQAQAQNGTATPQNGATNGSVLNLPKMQ